MELSRSKAALLVIDVQDRLFTEVENACEVMQTMQKVIQGFQILNLPILVTEQYPKGLGPTIATLKAFLNEDQQYLAKTSFSALKDEGIRTAIHSLGRDQWVLIGLEAHVCILQTAKDLLNAGKQVVVLNNGITSRSIYDFSTAIAEMRDLGIRISSAETVLFELLQNSNCPEFKSINQLIK